MKITRKILIYSIAFIFWVTHYTLHVTRISAQQITLSINPPIVEAIIKPGKSILVGYTITNSGDPITIRTKIRSFTPQGTNGAMNILDELQGPVRFSLENANLQLEQPLFMRTGYHDQAVVRMRIPEGTPDGDYYYVFLAETDTSPGINGSSGSIAKASIGSPLLITVTESGKMQVKGSIESLRINPRYTITLFNTTYQIIDSSDALPVSLTLKNEGNNVFKPEGTISLNGGFGDIHTRSIISQNVLADSSRTVNCSPNCSFSGFFIGSYRVLATIRLHEAIAPLTASTTFIGLPFKFIIGALIAFIITFTLVIRGKRKEKNKAEDQY